MKIRVSGKQIEIGEALPERVRAQLETAVSKHFDGDSEAHVVFSHEGSALRADCTAYLSSGVVLKAEGQGRDAHSAFDSMLAHMEKQVRRYKRKLKNHHPKTAVRSKASDSQQEG